MGGGGTGQLLRKAPAADVSPELDSVFVGVCFGGAQPETAGALPALVILTHLTEARTIERRRVFRDSDRDQMGALHACEANRLCQRPASRRGVVVSDQDSVHACPLAECAAFGESVPPYQRIASAVRPSGVPLAPRRAADGTVRPSTR
jgi:hypothetical protein